MDLKFFHSEMLGIWKNMIIFATYKRKQEKIIHMNSYITQIHVNHLYHLHDLTIKIEDPACSNLIITGKNGSGKTVLLEAITTALEEIFPPKNPKFKKLGSHAMLEIYKNAADNPMSETDRVILQHKIDQTAAKMQASSKNLELTFNDLEQLLSEYDKGNFLIAYYKAYRKTEFRVPVSPTKPELQSSPSIREHVATQLLLFLSDLKIQEALARNENQMEDADQIQKWFIDFEKILKSIFGDPNLKLIFNYRDYSFDITTEGKSFRFTQLSDGFVAVLDIVADLILRMQPSGRISAEYNKPGIVLIDEVETHLHLQLQKEILPLLTHLFPNIQFIVTTHSPFVLSSIPNATAYDLEHQEPIANLSEFSSQSLTEGYFKVTTESNYALNRYEELKSLLEKSELSYAERSTIRQLVEDIRKIPEAVAPDLVRAFRQLELDYNDKITSLGA